MLKTVRNRVNAAQEGLLEQLINEKKLYYFNVTVTIVFKKWKSIYTKSVLILIFSKKVNIYYVDEKVTT